MIKIEGWPDHPEGPATRLAVVRVASRHRPDLSDAAKQNAAQRLLNPPTTTTQPQPQRSRNDNAAATTTKPQRQRSHNVATTQPQRSRNHQGLARAGPWPGCRERRSGGRSRGNKAMHVRASAASEFASPPRERSPDREAEGRERLPATRPPRPAACQPAPAPASAHATRPPHLPPPASARHAPPHPHPTSPTFRARHFPRRTRSISPDESPEAPPTSCSPPPCPHALHVT